LLRLSAATEPSAERRVPSQLFASSTNDARNPQMAIANLQDLFEHTLQDIYYAEKQIVKALPKMAKAADAAQLRKAFEKHLAETEKQITRLDDVFKSLDKKPKASKCPAIEGIIKEAEELMGEIKDADTLDAAMIAAAQAVEHYEITRYGTLVSWGEMLGHGDACKLLQATLDEEKATDVALTALAESKLNKQAA
jgi:ferritin-like metal-binding protein YciE